jgi:8-oxo-dGTP diphosphatase
MQRFANVALIDARGWVLMQERDEHPIIDPDKWGFVGGHVDEGEGFLEAAYRELAEETGINWREGLTLLGEFKVFHQHSQSIDTFQLFVGSTSLTDSEVVVGEGRQIVFVEPDRLRGLSLTAAATIAVPALLDSDLYQALTPRAGC